MGLGMILVVLSLIVSFTMDTVAHRTSETNSTELCLLVPSTAISQPLSLLTVQLTLSALCRMLIYTAVFEFICSQSPHSMKGLLIGLLFAIKGLYNILATLFVGLWLIMYSYHPIEDLSCGFYYYLVNIVVGLIAVAVYVCVAKRYRYRERDEICNIRRYAEDYYFNARTWYSD